MSINLKSMINDVSAQLESWWSCADMSCPCLVIHVPKNQEDVPDTEDLAKFWTDSDFVVNRQMSLIDNRDYFGQAVPYHFMDFGASAMPCALGSDPDYVNKETIWAHPAFKSVNDILNLNLSEDNFCYRTILATTQKSIAVSKNHHMVSVYPLNGLTDILPGLYGTENFLLDLIEKPDLVKRAMEHFKQLWIREFVHITGLMKASGNPGGIGWAGVWCNGTTFPIQEDASYMLSPKMFNEFCIPHLYDIIDSMDYPMYHLDGIGAIPHLDSLLKIKKLKVIQWVPGAGKEEMAQWYEFLKYIISMGKSVQVFAKPDEVNGLVTNVGAKGLLITVLGASYQQAEELINIYQNKK